MADIESKIRDIVRGIMVEGCCPCAGCQEITTQRILALIAADRAGLVEALKGQNKKIAELKVALEIIATGNGPYNRDPFKHLENCYDHMIKVANKALEEVQNG